MLQRLQIFRRCLLALPLLVALAGWCAGAARAQGVELLTLQVERQEGALALDYAVRLQAWPRTW